MTGPEYKRIQICDLLCIIYFGKENEFTVAFLQHTRRNANIAETTLLKKKPKKKTTTSE